MAQGNIDRLQIDRGGIQCINGYLQIEGEFLFGVEQSCLADQDLGEVGVDPPVACLVGIRQVVA
ncbi:MAG: hypothetical protein IH898_04210 [Planctomycetes bacterium]|nr:hypothetical protein [Planctomycetota bacterium]